MKRITTLCMIACFMLLGSLSLNAQDKAAAIQEMAEEQAMELRKAFGLNDTQTKQLYSAIYKRDKTLTFTDYSQMSKQEKVTAVAATNDEFKQQLMSILTEEQFAKYAQWLEKKKNKTKE